MLTTSARLVTAATLIAVAAADASAQRMPEPAAIRRSASSTVPRIPELDRADKEGGFAKSGFAQFMSSPSGRILRVAAGVGMVAGGVVMRDDGKTNGGTALAVAGLIPLSAGVFDVCFLSPIFGGPFRGRDIRAANGK